MRVLFVTPFFEPAWALGGIVTASAAWARALVGQGVQVMVLTTTANAGSELVVGTGVPIDQEGFSVTYFPRFRWSGNHCISLGLLDSLRNTISSCDVVHSVGLWTFPSFMSSVMAVQNRIPYVVSLHGMLMEWAFGHHGRRKRIFFALSESKRLTKAQNIICSSVMEMRHFQAFGISKKATVIPNVVSPPDIETEVSRDRFRSLHSLQNALVLLFAGRIVRNKGLHLTVAAFAAIATEFPQARLVIVGPAENDTRSLLERQAADLNLTNRIHFLGTLSGSDYWDALAGADLFVLNSYSENFGYTPAEALALGVPVLLTDRVGIADLVSQYHAGLVTSLNVDTIVEAIRNMLSQQEMLRDMGRNGARMVRDNFSPSVVGRQFADLLEDTVRERRLV